MSMLPLHNLYFMPARLGPSTSIEIPKIEAKFRRIESFLSKLCYFPLFFTKQPRRNWAFKYGDHFEPNHGEGPGELIYFLNVSSSCGVGEYILIFFPYLILAPRPPDI